MTPKPRTRFLTVRIHPMEHKKFSQKAVAYGGVSKVLRELISAFTEDRAVIQPPSNHKDLYDNRK